MEKLVFKVKKCDCRTLTLMAEVQQQQEQARQKVAFLWARLQKIFALRTGLLGDLSPVQLVPVTTCAVQVQQQQQARF